MLKTVDLWPDDIATKRVRAPLTILREQAALLGQKTGNLVQGDVVSNARINNEYFIYEFYIEAPTLDNYSYKLLSVYHRIDLYPLEILVEEAIVREVMSKLRVGRVLNCGCFENANFALLKPTSNFAFSNRAEYKCNSMSRILFSRQGAKPAKRR